MTDVKQDPQEYLAPPLDSFWKWDEDADVVVWRTGGETIAFRVELEHILRSLVHRECGLPPLSLVLMVLAACRESWGAWLEECGYSSNFAANMRLDESDRERLNRGLMKLLRLKPWLRCPIEAKCHMVHFLFETSDACLSGNAAVAVCDALLLRNAGQRQRRSSIQGLPPEPSEGLAALLDGMDRLDEETLQLRMATGLDELICPAEIEPKDSTQTRELVASLLDDPEHGGLARLARAVMAVVHLPRPLLEPEELPMGGFSDIENRGSLDRLLVSELAYDDLTLAVRIALNEALYLRREAPPKTPALGRSVLIDAGIRMWGVPRVFATSVAMALMATADQHAAASVYRAEGAQVSEVDLTTRDGLTEHLKHLEPDVHPGRALAQFVAKSNREASKSDCVVVTCAESAADPQFQQYLARQEGNLYLATVTRSGEFQLLHQGAHGRKVICEAQLNLEDLLQRRRRGSVPLVGPGLELELPAIFRQEPFPLLLPHNRFNSHQSWNVPIYRVLEVSSDQRLLMWDSPGHGPSQIADHVPVKGSICWGELEPRNSKVSAIFGVAPVDLQLLTVDIAARHVTLEHLEVVDPPQAACQYAFCARDGTLLAITDHEVVVFRRANGQLVKRTALSLRSERNLALRHHRDRFFVGQSTGSWYALVCDELKTRFETIVDPVTAAQVELLDMFDWVGHEGPVAITRRAELYLPEEKQIRKLGDGITGPIRVLDVSPCGEWVQFQELDASAWDTYVVPLTSTNISNVGHLVSAEKLEAQRKVPTRRGDLHRRFTGVAAREDGSGLALISTKGFVWTIELQDSKLWLRPNVRSASDLQAHIQEFDQRVLVSNVGYRLDVATWPDGSRAFLDSRGLLHLRSSDKQIPEMTLVLVDGEMAGWSADRGIWGNDYYTDNDDSLCQHDAEETLLRFVERVI